MLMIQINSIFESTGVPCVLLLWVWFDRQETVPSAFSWGLTKGVRIQHMSAFECVSVYVTVALKRIGKLKKNCFSQKFCFPRNT